MSSVVSFGTNTAAQRKRVMYFGTSTIYEGMPVCYDNSTTNVLGIDTGASNAVSTTTTEGGQNEGKFLRVENPNADNVSLFAGVVAHGPKVGTTGVATGVWLDIFIPNGAIVPVRTDSTCLQDQTILAITTGSQELGVPLETDSRPVAIAREGYDRSTAGLMLAELCPYRFIHQDLGGTALSIDDADTSTATMVNHINLNFLGSATYTKGLYAVGQLSGAGACAYGMWKFRTYVNAALTGNAHTLCANLHLKEAAELTDTPEYASSPLYVTVETDGSDSPDLSGGSLAGIYFGYYVTESGGAPANAHALFFNSGTNNWDGLIKLQNPGDIGDSAQSGTAANVVGFDGDGTIRKIPVDVAGTTYYILIGTAAAETAD